MHYPIVQHPACMALFNTVFHLILKYSDKTHKLDHRLQNMEDSYLFILKVWSSLE